MSIKKYFLEVIKISFLNNIKALHQYSAIPTEIYACRKNAALFDRRNNVLAILFERTQYISHIITYMF